MYLKNDTKVSGQPYSQKSRSVLARISSAASLRQSYSTPLMYWAILECQTFKAAHGTVV